MVMSSRKPVQNDDEGRNFDHLGTNIASQRRIRRRNLSQNHSCGFHVNKMLLVQWYKYVIAPAQSDGC